MAETDTMKITTENVLRQEEIHQERKHLLPMEIIQSGLVNSFNTKLGTISSMRITKKSFNTLSNLVRGSQQTMETSRPLAVKTRGKNSSWVGLKKQVTLDACV